MDYRLLGEHTGLQVSALAIGTARLGTSADGGRNPAEAIKTLEAFATAGGNFIDTSSAYQGGASEAFVGEFLGSAGRDAFVLASKYGRTTEVNPAKAAAGNHRLAMIQEVEGSLQRLKTDRIDLYFVHFDDGLTPVEEIMRGLEDLVRSGKIVYLGLSNMPAWRMATAVSLASLRGWAPVAAMQMQYSLLERSIEREHLPFAQAAGLAVMAWSPLSGGLLGREGQAGNPVDEAFGAICTRLDKSRAETALCWVMAKGTIPVLGPRDRKQLSGSLGVSASLLSADEIAALDAIFSFDSGYPYRLLEDTRRSSGFSGLSSRVVL
jgi:aryl-alcohol dehydrogenase-like predicted oxidoreductase